jgi:predicted Rossmann-fold nucleotide-binding protein
MNQVPIVCFDRSYWSEVVDFEMLAAEGMISRDELDLFSYADDAESAWQALVKGGLRLPEKPSDSAAAAGREV